MVYSFVIINRITTTTTTTSREKKKHCIIINSIILLYLLFKFAIKRAREQTAAAHNIGEAARIHVLSVNKRDAARNDEMR